jgi:hypothetical protein
MGDLEKLDLRKMKDNEFFVSNEELMRVNEYAPALKENGAVAKHGKDLAIIT